MSIAPREHASAADDAGTRTATHAIEDTDTTAEAASAATTVAAALSPEASELRRATVQAAEELARLVDKEAQVPHVVSSPDGILAVALVTGKNFFLAVLNDGHSHKIGLVHGGLVAEDRLEFTDVSISDSYYFSYTPAGSPMMTSIPLRPFMNGADFPKEFLHLEALGIDPTKPEGERLDADRLEAWKEWRRRPPRS